jgi:D-lactate dehydrogenase (cytochrome)
MKGAYAGEQGIGNKSYLAQEQPAAEEIMRLVKGALDPKNIMNPGKVL